MHQLTQSEIKYGNLLYYNNEFCIHYELIKKQTLLLGVQITAFNIIQNATLVESLIYKALSRWNYIAGKFSFTFSLINYLHSPAIIPYHKFILALDGNAKRNSFHRNNLLNFNTFIILLVFISWNVNSKCCSTRRVKVVRPSSIPFNSFGCATCNTCSSRNSEPCWVLQYQMNKHTFELVLFELC